MTGAATASRAAVHGAHQGLPPELPDAGLTPAPALRFALPGVVLGTAAVWLKIDVLLPVVGQAVPLATLGVPPPRPLPLAGLTLEQARLGTVAGIMDTGAAVPVLLVLLDRPPAARAVEVPEDVALFSAIAGEIAGAIERVTGAGKLPLATPAGPPVNTLSAGAMGGGDRDATGGTAAAGALAGAAAASGPLPAAWALPPAACVPPAAGALLAAAVVFPASGGVR